MAEFKTAKDTLVASLFELSKAAQEAATAAIDFYKVVNTDDDKSQQHLDETLKTVAQVADVVNGHKELADIAAAAVTSAKEEGEDETQKKKKKKKVERDPNAPKKPLTMYFAFSFQTRREIAEERKKQGLPSLSAIDMNSLVKERWANTTDEEKQEWQQKYRDQLKIYNVEKEKYKSGLAAAPVIEPAEELEVHEPVVPKLDDITKTESPKKSHKKRKSDKEKGEKKEKKKKLSVSQ